MTLEQLHTQGLEDGGDKNKIEVKFTAVMLDVGETLGGAAAGLADQTYYVTVGVSYGTQQFVWVGQQEVTVVLVDHVSVKIFALLAPQP